MLPIARIIWNECFTADKLPRVNEPHDVMDNAEQVAAYVEAYRWGGAASTLQLHHLRALSYLLRPGETIVDLACGPGPLLLELAQLFPQCHFIGIDLSRNMLDALEREAANRHLTNIEVLQEDASQLPSIESESIDIAITTSALHHLPNEGVVRNVFQAITRILKNGGGYYISDFGQLKSRRARQLCVAEVAKLAPTITAHDYELSLDAAYPIDRVFSIAQESLPKPIQVSATSFVNFLYFIHSPPRTIPEYSVSSQLQEFKRTLSTPMNLELLMLRWLKRTQTFN